MQYTSAYNKEKKRWSYFRSVIELINEHCSTVIKRGDKNEKDGSAVAAMVVEQFLMEAVLFENSF